MKKLVLLGLGAVAVASATALGTGVADSDPGASTMNVVGEPYGKAIAILKSQGVKGTFGGSVGSDVPQAQCIVDGQKVLHSGKMLLMLNCTSAAAAAAGGGPAGSPGPASLGGNGITTVTATPVGPQGDMGPIHPGGT